MGVNIGDRIKRFRIEKGLTQEELAAAIGNTKAAISRYELNQRQPRMDQLFEIAKALGISVDCLLDIPDMSGKTERYEPWTQADEMILQAGGFQALAEFNFLSDADKTEALKDINKFIEFTLSKYKQQDRAEPPSAPILAAPEGTDTPTPEPPPESPEKGK